MKQSHDYDDYDDFDENTIKGIVLDGEVYCEHY